MEVDGGASAWTGRSEEAGCRRSHEAPSAGFGLASFFLSSASRISTAFSLHPLPSRTLFPGKPSRHLAGFLPMPCICPCVPSAFPLRLPLRENANPLQSDGQIRVCDFRRLGTELRKLFLNQSQLFHSNSRSTFSIKIAYFT